MKITFLGTGAGAPTLARGATSIVLSEFNRQQELWLVDCGEGTLHQLLRSKLKVSALSTIFITHLHGDHLFGLPGLLSCHALQSRQKPLTLFGPSGLKTFLDMIFRLSESRINYPLIIQEISPGIIFENEAIHISAGELDHRILCFGYRFVFKKEKKDLYSNNDKKTKKIKVNIDLMHSSEKNATIKNKPLEEKIIAIFGDTRITKSALPLAWQADVLIHEATYDNQHKEKAEKYGHSTTDQAAHFALNAKANLMIITHFSSRYRSPDLSKLLDECRAIFPKTEIAKDFAQFEL